MPNGKLKIQFVAACLLLWLDGPIYGPDGW
jgi:hypothetical protein